MDTHEAIQRDIVEQFGAVRSVSVVTELLAQPEEYELTFDGGVLLVGVNAEDDSIRLGRGTSSLPKRIDVSSWYPWNMVIGLSVVWAWSLRNQSGYEDAIQLSQCRARTGHHPVGLPSLGNPNLECRGVWTPEHAI